MYVMKVVKLHTPTRLDHSFMDQEAIRRPMPSVCAAVQCRRLPEYLCEFGVLGC